VIAECPYTLQLAPLSPKTAIPMGDLDPHLTYDFLDPFEPTTQTASRSVQPFCTDDRSVLYFTMGAPLPKIAPSHGGSGPPFKTWFLGPPESST